MIVRSQHWLAIGLSAAVALALAACTPKDPPGAPSPSATPTRGTPSGTVAPTTAAPSASPSPTAPVSPSTSETTSTGQPFPAQLKTRPIDGGPGYNARFANGLPTSANFFPIGVWFESLHSADEAATDAAAGINTYVALTANSDLTVAEKAGMNVVAQADEWGKRGGVPGNRALKGWMLSDETDMIEGPVQGPKTLAAIVSSLPAGDGRVRYANYGKGVTFWETDQEAAQFVNNFQDIVSADNYWFTDRNICSAGEGGALILDGARALRPEECALAANYGKTVQRVRDLQNPAGSKPVWNFVEVGHPFTEDDWPSITAPQVRAAVWSGIIHGARGVVYFNHSFGGPHQTQHALRDAPYASIRSIVTSTNAQLKSLAPALNSPDVIELVKAEGAVETLTKYDKGRLYVIAGASKAIDQTARIAFSCTGDATVTVLGEGRELQMKAGAFSDRFADGNAVHIYQVDAGSSCGLT